MLLLSNDWLAHLANSLVFPTPRAWMVVGELPVQAFSPVVFNLQLDFSSFFADYNLGNSSFTQGETVLSPFLLDYKTNYDAIRFELAHRLHYNPLLMDSALETRIDQQQHLTHVVFALPLFQFESLWLHMHEMWTTRYPPCKNREEYSQIGLLVPHLVFFVALNESQVVPVVDPHLPVFSCFASVTVSPLVLAKEEDNRVLGSKLLWEHFLRAHYFTQPVGFALYLEPDVIFLQPQWLTSLALSVRHQDHVWIQGSMFLGPSEFVRKKWLPRKSNANKLYFHMNGNALYNLGGEFSAFYFSVIKPYMEKRHGIEGAHRSAMDVDLFEFLLDCPGRWEEKRELVKHLRYTDLIGNFYFLPRNESSVLSKNFVLIHAKPSDKW